MYIQLVFVSLSLPTRVLLRVRADEVSLVCSDMGSSLKQYHTLVTRTPKRDPSLANHPYAPISFPGDCFATFFQCRLVGIPLLLLLLVFANVLSLCTQKCYSSWVFWVLVSLSPASVSVE